MNTEKDEIRKDLEEYGVEEILTQYMMNAYAEELVVEYIDSLNVEFTNVVTDLKGKFNEAYWKLERENKKLKKEIEQIKIGIEDILFQKYLENDNPEYFTKTQLFIEEISEEIEKVLYEEPE